MFLHVLKVLTNSIGCTKIKDKSKVFRELNRLFVFSRGIGSNTEKMELNTEKTILPLKKKLTIE